MSSSSGSASDRGMPPDHELPPEVLERMLLRKLDALERDYALCLAATRAPEVVEPLSITRSDSPPRMRKPSAPVAEAAPADESRTPPPDPTPLPSGNVVVLSQMQRLICFLSV
jgi:hypothetical protein